MYGRGRGGYEITLDLDVAGCWRCSMKPTLILGVVLRNNIHGMELVFSPLAPFKASLSLHGAILLWPSPS